MSIIIVGAGLSGLTAALHLLDLGCKDTIRVVDARERVGGRLLAHEGVDVGGAWCWKSVHHECPHLARRLSVPTFPQYDKGWSALDLGNSIMRSDEPFDSAKLRFGGGAFAVTSALADHVRERGVTVQLGCRINHIDTTDPDGVRVGASQAGSPVEWKAKAVLMAVPPRVILPPVIAWSPALPPGLSSAIKGTPTWMGQTTKVLVTYAKPFWRAIGSSGNAMAQGHGGPIHQLYDSCGPEGTNPSALCGFIFSQGLDGPPTDKELRPQALLQLERMFGEDALTPLSFTTFRWINDPLTNANGGGTGGGHGSMGNPRLRRPFGGVTVDSPGRVWLCGSETNDQHSGLMEGAVLAGRRASEEVFNNI